MSLNSYTDSREDLLNTKSDNQRHTAPILEISSCYSDDIASTLNAEAQADEKKVNNTSSLNSADPGGEDLPPYTLKEYQKDAWSRGKDAQPDNQRAKTTWLGFSQMCWQWKGEVAFLSISVCSLMAVIVLLALADGTAHEDWPFFLSINTVISILGTASRASLATAVGSCLAQEKWNWFLKRQDHLLMFDRIESASRGEIGSFKLLFWLKFRYWASLGAAIVVVLLAYDPFIQSLVDQSGESYQVDVPRPAAIAASPGLDVGILVGESSSYVWDWKSSDNTSSCTRIASGLDFHSLPDLGMISSVYDGFALDSTSTTRTPISSCSSGNCTWPRFASLAVCGSCRDVSQYINSTTEYVSTNTETGNQTTFFLPLNNISGADPGTNLYAVGKRHLPRNTVSFYPATMTAMGTVEASDLITFVDSTTFLMGFSLIFADEAYLDGSVAWNASRPTGTECGLELCTKIYESEVVDGELSEKVLSSSFHRNEQSLRPGLYPLHSYQNDGCSQMWSTIVNTSLWYDTKAVGNVARTDLQLFVSDDDLKQYNVTGTSRTTFNITDGALRSTVAWMKDQFTNQQLIWYGNLEETYINMIDGNTFWGQAPITSALKNQSGLEATFGRVADSMTTWMRNLAFEQGPVTGTTWAWTKHIRVIWPFIAFPIIATLAGCIYCLVVIVETRDLGLKPWTDSCLATMAYGIGDDTRGRLQQSKDIKKEAKNIHMGARWARGWKECAPLEARP